MATTNRFLTIACQPNDRLPLIEPGTHYELSPWLASVYVRTDMRGNGVGAGLVKNVMKMAKEAGLVNMYLFTPSAQKFYESLGWSRKYVENYKGEEATIMEVTL